MASYPPAVPREPAEANPTGKPRAFPFAARARASPYYPALIHPVLRRVLPGAAASALGDGMSAVAIAWLALKRLETGRYGMCERCGQPIGEERLAAQPAAVTCIRCAART